MWKRLCIFFISFCLLFMIPMVGMSEADQQEEPPAYAKWGRMAMKETQKRYPDARIVDYLHIERESTNGRTTEKFKLWLVRKEREFGVYIFIEFDSETEENIELIFTETDR